MSKVKNNDSDALTPHIVDISQHYDFHYKCTVGCGIGYSVRNHTQNVINVKSRVGFSQDIAPYSDTYDYKALPEELKKDSVWLDVHLYIDNVNWCFNLKPQTSNTLDNIIIREVSRQVGAAIHSEYSTMLGFSAHFSICLNSVLPNYGNNGFQSDLFNIVIKYDNSDRYKDFLATIPNKFIDHLKNNQIDFSCATYQLTMLVDNHDECDNLWMLQAGKPIKIVPTKNLNMPSGIYLFLNKYHIRDKPYIFISLDDIRQNDNKLREYGLSYTEKEVLETARTADYVELKKAYEKKESEHIKQTVELEKKQQAFNDIKTAHEHATVKIEQISADLSTETEEKKQLISSNNALTKHLDKMRAETEKLKRDIIEKEDKNRDLKDTIRSIKYKSEIESVKQFKKGSWFSHFLAGLGETVDLIKKAGVVKTLLLGTG